MILSKLMKIIRNVDFITTAQAMYSSTFLGYRIHPENVSSDYRGFGHVKDQDISLNAKYNNNDSYRYSFCHHYFLTPCVYVYVYFIINYRSFPFELYSFHFFFFFFQGFLKHLLSLSLLCILLFLLLPIEISVLS